jgi:O-methyltransferase involved in polyketide biosynthesis
MNPVSDTAYYCRGVRMQDAQRAYSLCSDEFAKVFMDERGLKIFDRFKDQVFPNLSNITRCRIIDDAVNERLKRDPTLNIISIGAGFDTRPFRQKGGHWIELDEPQIIEHKNIKLPASQCANPLQRIAVRFAEESLVDKLATLNSAGPVLIIIEGVLMYLDQAAIEKTIVDLQARFPQHDLLCDLMPRVFFDKYSSKSVHKLIKELGAVFAPLPEKPEAIFLKHGYQEVGVVSAYQRAHDIGAFQALLKMPRFVSGLLLRFVMPDLNGYAVHEFKFNASRAR